jgi:hypothetical protein
VLTNLEAWIRRRLRSYLWRQWQNGHNRFNELRLNFNFPVVGQFDIAAEQ